MNRDYLIAAAISGGIALTGVKGCTSTQQKQAEAEGSYAAQQTKCIADAKTRDDADACRNAVKSAWSVDASTEGGAK